MADTGWLSQGWSSGRDKGGRGGAARVDPTAETSVDQVVTADACEDRCLG